MMLADAPCRPTIAVSDKEKAKAFYGDTVGLSLVDENPVGATFCVRVRDLPRDLPLAVCGDS